jgi:hypothetical protein
LFSLEGYADLIEPSRGAECRDEIDRIGIKPLLAPAGLGDVTPDAVSDWQHASIEAPQRRR